MIIIGIFGMSILITIWVSLFSSIGSVTATLKHVYQNFFHWSASKLMILWAMIGVFVLICLPIVMVLMIIAGASDITLAEIIGYFFWWNNGEANFFVAHGNWTVLLQIIELVLFAVVGFLLIYSRVLLHRVHLSYIKWKQLSYMKNFYFDIKRMLLVARYSIVGLCIAALPVVVFAAVLWALLFFSNGQASIAIAQSSLLQIWVFLFFVVIAFISIILLFRLYFGLILIADKKKITQKDTLKTYLSKSKDITTWWKKVLLAFVPVVLFIGVIFLPKDYLQQYLQVSMGDTQNYIIYSGLADDQKQQILASEQFGYYYNALEIYYSGESVDAVQRYFYTLYILFISYQIASFFIVFGLFEMMMLWIYTTYIKK